MSHTHSLVQITQKLSQVFSSECAVPDPQGKFLVSCLPALCRRADRYTVGSLYQAGHRPRIFLKMLETAPFGEPTWSRRIWQTSGVKWRRAARDLLRILRRLYCTVSRAFCSAASDSGLGCLEEAWGFRCTRGVMLDGRESPFFVWGDRKGKVLNDKYDYFALGQMFWEKKIHCEQTEWGNTAPKVCHLLRIYSWCGLGRHCIAGRQLQRLFRFHIQGKRMINTASLSHAEGTLQQQCIISTPCI